MHLYSHAYGFFVCLKGRTETNGIKSDSIVYYVLDCVCVCIIIGISAIAMQMLSLTLARPNAIAHNSFSHFIRHFAINFVQCSSFIFAFARSHPLIR